MGKKMIVMILVAMIAMASAAGNRPFVWADDEAYWPAIYRGKDGKPAGIFNDVLTEVFKRLHIPLEKSVYPWKRAQQLVKSGQADGMVTFYTRERKTFSVATEPVWNIGETLFFRRDTSKACKILKINSFDQMRGLTLVDIQGAGWSKEEYKAHGIKDIVWVPTVESAFNMLAKGRVDAFIMFDLNAYNILSRKRTTSDVLQKGYQNIVAITPTFALLPFRLLIQKHSPFAGRVDEINRVLEAMQKDGTYQRILQKYAGISPLL